MSDCPNLARANLAFLSATLSMSARRTEKIYTRVSAELAKAFNIKCAELGISRPDGLEAAVKAWLRGAETPEDVEFTCRFCRAHYQISPANPQRAEVLEAPITPEVDQPRPKPETQWLVDEFIRMLEDPEEKYTLDYLSSLFARRRRERGE